MINVTYSFSDFPIHREVLISLIVHKLEYDAKIVDFDESSKQNTIYISL